jgi:hypothetical protein
MYSIKLQGNCESFVGNSVKGSVIAGHSIFMEILLNTAINVSLDICLGQELTPRPSEDDHARHYK